MLSIEEYLTTRLRPEWHRARLHTLVGQRYMQEIGGELDEI
jgi:hypothetical protein